MNITMDRTRIILTPKALLEIEAALNEPLFFGIPVGVTLNDRLIVELYNGNRVWNWRTRATDLLRYYYHRFYQPFLGSADLSRFSGRMVFTWLFDRADLKAFVLPLLEKYGTDQSIVVAPLASMQAQLPDQTAFVTWDEFPKIDMKLWRREFDRCSPIWRQRLNQVLAKHVVPPYVAEFLLWHLQIQTQRLMAFSHFLDIIRPKAIVTEFDRNEQSSCLVLAARQRSIPAVTMVHGALTPYPSYGYAPLLANYACCWGELHKHNLMEHGVDQDQLVVTGCQGITRTLGVKQDSARMEIGAPVDKPVILLATSPIKLEDRKHYASVFCAAMSRLPEMTAIVRLHPAENMAQYQEVIDKFPKVTFLANDAMTRDESLAAADIVVVHESGFGIDALLKGKLVVILDVLATPLRIGKELIALAGCPSARGPDEFESVIRKILTDAIWKRELHVKAEQYVLQYCASYGQDAVNNVCRVIDHAIESSKQKTA